MRFSSFAAFTTLVFATFLQAQEPRSGVPALNVGDAAKTSFVVEGFLLDKNKRGVALRVATDGQQHLFCLADATDNVPIFISDGVEGLLYDLAQEQILRVPNSCFGFQLSFDPEEPSFRFRLSCLVSKDEAKRRKCLPNIDFARFQETKQNFERSVSETGEITFTVKRANQKIDRLDYDPKQPSCFRYTMFEPGQDRPGILIRASHLGEKIPPELLLMPDPRNFGKKLPWHQEEFTETEDAQAFFHNKYRYWLTKFTIAMTAEDDETLNGLIPNLSRDELRQRDKQLGESYLGELKTLKFELPSPPSALLKAK